MFNCQRKCVSKWSSPYLLINLILWMRTTWSHAFTKLTEQDRLMGYSEVFTFLFDPIECNKTSYVHKCETDILVEKLPEWTWMLLHDRRWGSFSPRTSWIHSLHKKMWWPPDVLWPPLTGKAAVFTGDRLTNQRRREMYSYSLMQTKHLSSKIIQFCTICKLRNIWTGKTMEFLWGTL